MSYSRWGNSTWYTFWACSRDGIPETYDNAIFEICGIVSFSAKELRDDIESCIVKVRCECLVPGIITPTDDDVIELRGYMQRFIVDVEKKYTSTRG